MLPIEIKSGQTITSDYFKGLKRFRRVFQDLPFGELVIYAGDMIQNRTGVKVFNVMRFSGFLRTLDT